MHALLVGLGELALGVEGGDGGAELAHGVHVGGQVVEESHHVAGQLGPAGPVLGQAGDLGVGGQE